MASPIDQLSAATANLAIASPNDDEPDEGHESQYGRFIVVLPYEGENEFHKDCKEPVVYGFRPMNSTVVQYVYCNAQGCAEYNTLGPFKIAHGKDGNLYHIDPLADRTLCLGEITVHHSTYYSCGNPSCLRNTQYPPYHDSLAYATDGTPYHIENDAHGRINFVKIIKHAIYGLKETKVNVYHCENNSCSRGAYGKLSVCFEKQGAVYHRLCQKPVEVVLRTTNGGIDYAHCTNAKCSEYRCGPYIIAHGKDRDLYHYDSSTGRNCQGKIIEVPHQDKSVYRVYFCDGPNCTIENNKGSFLFAYEHDGTLRHRCINASNAFTGCGRIKTDLKREGSLAIWVGYCDSNGSCSKSKRGEFDVWYDEHGNTYHITCWGEVSEAENGNTVCKNCSRAEDYLTDRQRKRLGFVPDHLTEEDD
ncbi:MAG: hypothetical protein ABW189_03190 [Rickettsiales bacterium]